MNGVATGGIKAVCPECSTSMILSHAELGQEVECWKCGTSFYVVRHRHRKRVSHMPRTECLLRRSGPASRPPQPELQRAMSLVFLLLVIAMSGAFIAVNWSGVKEGAAAMGDLLRPQVQVAPEVPVVEQRPQILPRERDRPDGR